MKSNKLFVFSFCALLPKKKITKISLEHSTKDVKQIQRNTGRKTNLIILKITTIFSLFSWYITVIFNIRRNNEMKFDQHFN